MPISRLGLVALATALGPSLVSAQGISPSLPAQVAQMHSAIYTKEFAKRFALPEPEARTEPRDGIQGLEFSIEEGPKGVPYYYCKLALYVDNKLPIAFPEEGDSGSSRILSSHPHFFSRLPEGNERWPQWSVEDRRFFNDRQGRYTLSARLASADYVWQKSGWSTGIFYNDYYRELFPNLAYLKVDIGCPNALHFRRHQSIFIWLKRVGARDYRRVLKTDPEDFLKFALPRSFINKILPWMEAAEGYNEQVRKDERRKERE